MNGGRGFGINIVKNSIWYGSTVPKYREDSYGRSQDRF